jgi:hypothetical protein
MNDAGLASSIGVPRRLSKDRLSDRRSLHQCINRRVFASLIRSACHTGSSPQHVADIARRKTMNRGWKLGLALAAAAALVAAPAVATAQKKQRLAFGGGPTGGTFQYFSNAIAIMLSKSLPNVEVSSEGTGGSAENLKRLDSGEVDFGIVYSGDLWLGSRGELLERVWGLRPDTRTRVIDSFVVRLRRYLEADPSRPRHLLAVRGHGYRLLR